MKKLLILGSTGSVGTQTLDIVRASRDEYEVVGLCTNSNTALLSRQAQEFGVQHVGVFDADAAGNAAFSPGVAVHAGPEGIADLCQACAHADMAVLAIVGIAGLAPAVACMELGMDIALANKETLVAGGALVKQLAARHNLRILPVDSEHSAIFQCLQGLHDNAELARVILTASGGPFYSKTRDELAGVTAAQALKHPNWSMGAKITIDSASMMNKGLEVIEARWLFDVPPERIDVLVHRQSIVHSLIELVDGSVLAQLGEPDMRIPIQYALTYPKRVPGIAPRLNLATAGELTFAPPDMEVFRPLALAYEALRKGNAACVAINAANEAAVELFLQGSIRFLDIERIIEKALGAAPGGDCGTLEDVFALDDDIRQGILRR